ncbi:MAG: PspC domain-containing protein [Bacteroidetes bacterium]|nr:PspC domain-containing protein [Bacteroidota bacterium]
MSTRKLTRSAYDKKIAGVCGGIAEYFGIDATLVRVGYVLLSLLSAGFPLIVVYVILAFVMPEK